MAGDDISPGRFGTYNGDVNAANGQILVQRPWDGYEDAPPGHQWIAIDTDYDGKADVWGGITKEDWDARIGSNQYIGAGAMPIAPNQTQLPPSELPKQQGTVIYVENLSQKGAPAMPEGWKPGDPVPPAEGQFPNRFKVFIDTDNNGAADKVLVVSQGELDRAMASGNLSYSINGLPEVKPYASGDDDPGPGWGQDYYDPKNFAQLHGDAGEGPTKINPAAVEFFVSQLREIGSAFDEVLPSLRNLNVQPGTFSAAQGVRDDFMPMVGKTTESTAATLRGIQKGLDDTADRLVDSVRLWKEAAAKNSKDVKGLETYILSEFAGDPTSTTGGATGGATGDAASGGASGGAASGGTSGGSTSGAATA